MNKIKNLLNLEEMPIRIESYDISNISGTDTVAGMIVFENGKPKKNEYRRIKLGLGPNGFFSKYISPVISATLIAMISCILMLEIFTFRSSCIKAQLNTIVHPGTLL